MEHIDPDIPEEKPTVCPKCGNKNLLDGWLLDDQQWDEERANEYGVEFGDDFDKSAKFAYVHDWVYCDGEIQDGDDWDDCDYQSDYGRRYYYNKRTNNYDLPRPPTPKEKKRKEAKARENRQLTAGQLALFSTDESEAR